MRAYVTLKFNKPLIMPIQYNHIMQAVVLKWINDEKYTTYLHDKGFALEKRVFKLYTFSRLEGDCKYDREKSRLVFKSFAKFTISTADENFLDYVVRTAIVNDTMSILGQEVYVDNVRCMHMDIMSEKRIHTLSPIVTYSTFEHDGRKKTYYYNPMEEEFSRLIKENLVKKYIAFNGKEPSEREFTIKPAPNGRLKESIVIYKGTVIKGWNGDFIISGSPELLTIGYNAGLGSKNAQGFGCIEI